ncbi:MAG: tetratricopeptide repeat protein [Vulcanimicrobiota bacterium]
MKHGPDDTMGAQESDWRKVLEPSQGSAQAMSKEKILTSEGRLEELQEGSLAAPKDSELNLTLGEAFLRVNRVDEAAAAYQRAVELDPRSDLRALFWEWLGLVREMEGRLEEALEAYFQWLDADPVAISPLDRLGSLLVVLGRWTDLRLLEQQFERRVEVSGHARSRESLALYTFVMEQFGQRDTEGAKVATLAALESDPDSPAMRFLLGLITYQEGSLELARGEFERVLELDAEGLWQEPRFALDWNGSKARVMVAKLARQQGDVETALRLLIEAEDLDRSDSEGLAEVAELLIENERYDDLLKVLRNVPEGPSRLKRMEAEGLLGRGLLTEADSIFETEASLFGVHLPEEPLEATLSDPAVSSEVLLGRLSKGLLTFKSAEEEVLGLCRTYPQVEQVWETARLVYEQTGQLQRAQIASLVKSKLRHGPYPDPSGAYTKKGADGTRVLVGLITEGGPLILKLEADSGRKDRDQLFGWGRDALMPGLELAKGILEDLVDDCPRSFRVMITPVSVPQEGETLKILLEGELGSIPLGFLVAMLSFKKEPEGEDIAVLGRLGLRGDIGGVSHLEETLMALHQSGAHWDRLVVAEAGGFRLLRAPAWLWHGRKVTMVDSADALATWSKEVTP